MVDAPADIVRALRSLDREKMSPVRWAERCFRIRDLDSREIKPIRFDRHPFLRQVLNDFHPQMVIMKGAQLGFTVCLLIRTLHWIDRWGYDILYLLPTADDCGDFSKARFDAALDASPDLIDLFSDVSNVGHKRAGMVNLYLRGTHSRSKLKSVPVAAILQDEFDDMHQVNLALARKRTSGQVKSFDIKVSTPSWPGFGIDAEWRKSDQHRWWVPCPHCDESQHLTWEGNIRWQGSDPATAIETATFCCASCGEVWTNAERLAAVQAGVWIAEDPGADIRGYHLNQLASPVQDAARLVKEFFESRDTPELWREFINQTLGLPLAEQGGQLMKEQVRACRDGYMLAEGSGFTMGVDQGAIQGGSLETVHYWAVSEWEDDPLDPTGRRRVVRAMGKAESWDELDDVWARFDPCCCVLDNQPDPGRALDFSRRHPRKVWLAYYKRGGLKGGEFCLWGRKQKKRTGRCVDIDRTTLFDRMLARFHAGLERVAIPTDHPPELESHLTAMVRIIEKDRSGNPRAFYRTPQDKSDHFAHALAYDEVASERQGQKGAVMVL